MPTQEHTHVVSSTPERTRLRVSHKRRNTQEMARIAKALKAYPEVNQVRTNLQTGSIVVHHEPEFSRPENISAILQDLGIVLSSVIEPERPLNRGKSEVAADFTSAVANLNEQVGKATNGAVDLRLLVPAGFATLALRQMLRNGLELEIVPWYVLAWYAFDSFIKLHYTADPDATK